MLAEGLVKELTRGQQEAHLASDVNLPKPGWWSGAEAGSWFKVVGGREDPRMGYCRRPYSLGVRVLVSR